MIELTNSRGNRVLVNAKNIKVVREFSDNRYPNSKTAITFDDGELVQFQQSYDEVCKMIQGNEVKPTKDDILSINNKVLIDYIEQAEIGIPIDDYFCEDGATRITKKQYGKVLIKYLVKDLRERFI